MDLLRSEFNLMDDVRMVQLFYLMEAGAITHQFTDEVFHKVSLPHFSFPSLLLPSFPSLPPSSLSPSLLPPPLTPPSSNPVFLWGHLA